MIDQYVQALRELPFVTGVRAQAAPSGRHARFDYMVTVKTKRGTHAFATVEYKTHLSTELAHSAIKRAIDNNRHPTLLLVPHVGANLGRQLATSGLNYLDRQGNCHLVIDDEVMIHVEGRASHRTESAERGIRAAGYQALFAYLAEPGLVTAPLRTIAERAGVSRQAAHDMRTRLVNDGSLVKTTTGLRWVSRRFSVELQRWLHGYRTSVRPSILIGTYRTPNEDPDKLERAIEEVAKARNIDDWVWGGAAAAFRLTHHYRGRTTTVHIDDRPQVLAKDLRALQDPGGHLTLLSAFGNLDWQEGQRTANPLLVYSELLVLDDERARESAEQLFDRYIRPTWESAA